MGFFSDLKEDLNQAVNELMPEGETDMAPDGVELPEENEEAVSQGTITSEDLSDMLERMDETVMESELEMPEEQEPVSDYETEELEANASDYDMPEYEAELLSEDSQETEIYNMEEMADAEEAEQPMEEEMAEESILEPIAEENESFEESEGEENSMDDIMNIETKVVSDETAVVTEGMSITGDITSGGSLELIGNVIGNIEILGKLNITGGIQGNSKAAEIYAEGARINGEVVSQGSVKIGQSSVVIGNITANSAVIAGAVKGDIDVHGPVILDTSAIVMGNIKSKSVQINNGAVIEGMCSQCYADVNPTSFFDEINKKSKKKEK